MYLKNKLDILNDGLFESNTATRIKNIMKRFLRGQEKGKLKNINGLFDSNLFSNFIFINKQFFFYKLRYDAICDSDDDDTDDSSVSDVSDDDSSDDDSSDDDYVSDDDSSDDDSSDVEPYPGFIEFYDIFKNIYIQIKNDDDDDNF